MMDNLRAYFFNNMYLTGIHAGIQAQHCTAEMFMKYSGYGATSENKPWRVLHNWAEDEKTTIILNGGYASNLLLIESLFEDEENEYPWDVFHESEDALEGCITSVGIILPERIYSAKPSYGVSTGYNTTNIYEGITPYEQKLVECVQGYRLMS